MAQLKTFSPTDLADLLAVYDTGSMTKAAELNQRTKPAVSMTITRLERAVGFAILEKPSWSVKFTERGEALVTKARAVMAEMDALSKLANVLATGTEPQLAVAVDNAVPRELWLPAINRVAAAYVDTKIELIAADGEGGQEMLRTGRVQAAIGLDTDLLGADDLEWEVLQDVEFLDVCRVGTAFHGAERPSSIPQVVLMDDSNHSSCQHSPRCIHVSSRLLQLSLVLDGIGWARLPAHLISDQLDSGRLLQFTPSPDVPFHPSAVICRTKEVAGPVASFLWGLLS